MSHSREWGAHYSSLPPCWPHYRTCSSSIPLLSPPYRGSPQVTKLPSPKRAANAASVECTLRTCLSWCCTARLSPPKLSSPQVTTDPSARIAAKAPVVEWSCLTFFRWSWTSRLSPPESGSPQATAFPEPSMAANAVSVDLICCTSLSWCWTRLLSPPDVWSPQVTTVPSAQMAEKAWRVAWISLTLWSRPWTALLSPPHMGSPWIAFGDLVAKKRRKKKQDMPQFWWINHQLNKSKSPHVTTVPSLKIAAKAPSVDCTCWTFWRRSRTALLSPPHFALPQVTTLPSPGLQNLQLGPRNRPTTSQNGRLQDQIVWNQFETLSSDCRKSTIRRLHLQHVPEFILNCTAITTTVCTPGHDLAICSDCSKGPGWCSLYCLHTWYLLQVVIKIQNIPNRFPKWRVNQQKIDSATPGHCVTDPGLQCCHHQSPDGPRWRLHRFPRWRQKNRPMPGWSEHLQDSQFHPGWALSLKKWRSTKSTGIVLPNSLRMENKNIFSLKKPKQKKTCQDITQWSKPQPSITITTIFRMAPGDNRSICQDGRESTMGRLHLLHTSQPQLDPAAVATRQPTAPRHDTVPSTTEECEGGARGSKRWILGNRTETAAISSCSIAGVRSSTTYQVYQEPDVLVVVLIPKSWGVYRPPK